jgi:type II secretory pathway pseudopilin PulG
MIELLVMMVIIGILATMGAKSFNSVSDSARLSATIDEMRNVVNLLEKLESRLGGQVGGAWASTPTFPVTGTILALNASQTFVKVPPNNKYSSSSIDYPYYFTITPTVKIYTTIPMKDVSPAGFYSGSFVNGATSTVLEVYPKPDILVNTDNRRKWIDNFYYKQTYKELKAKQAASKTLPNYSRGTYVPD